MFHPSIIFLWRRRNVSNCFYCRETRKNAAVNHAAAATAIYRQKWKLGDSQDALRCFRDSSEILLTFFKVFPVFKGHWGALKGRLGFNLICISFACNPPRIPMGCSGISRNSCDFIHENLTDIWRILFLFVSISMGGGGGRGGRGGALKYSNECGKRVKKKKK